MTVYRQIAAEPCIYQTQYLATNPPWRFGSDPRQKDLPAHSCGRSSLKQRMRLRRPGAPAGHGSMELGDGWMGRSPKPSQTTFLTARQGRLKFADFKKTIGKARMLPIDRTCLPFHVSASNVATKKSACLEEVHETIVRFHEVSIIFYCHVCLGYSV